MTRIRLADNYRLPMSEADNDGRCVLSDLLPTDCGLPCHRNSAPVPVVDDLPDDIWADAA